MIAKTNKILQIPVKFNPKPKRLFHSLFSKIALIYALFVKIGVLVGSRGFAHGTSGDITRFFPQTPPFFEKIRTKI